MNLTEILTKHGKWLDDTLGGERANLQGADLQGADFQDANLRCANLRCAELQCANLQDADLQCADLRDANLRCANLQGADLRDANLQGADLEGADLQDAYLQGANLRCANLRCADLQDADLHDAYLEDAYQRIPVTLEEVRDVILGHVDKLNMSNWHSDERWHNGTVREISECGTTHCMAGFAHLIAAKRRPELLDEKINVELVGRLALGEEVARRFYDTNESVLEWLRGLE